MADGQPGGPVSIWTRGIAGIVAATLAVLACYGTLALVAVLPLVGVRLAVNDAVWSGTILLFTMLAVLAVVPGSRRHGSPVPGAGAITGAGLIVFALLVEYHALVELAGFVILTAAAFRDAFLRRRQRLEALGVAAR